MSKSQYLILNIDQHYFAVNVNTIEDVIKQNKKTAVPLSSSNIGGVLNLRGYIVTEINVAQTLGIRSAQNNDGFAVVINRKDELYSLAFDNIGDVIEIAFSEIAPLPETIQKSWHQLSKGVYRQDDKLVVILDLVLFVESLLEEETSRKPRMSSPTSAEMRVQKQPSA